MFLNASLYTLLTYPSKQRMQSKSIPDVLFKLPSNILQFTHAGGRIHLRTKLIYPTKDDPRPWTAKISGGETTGFPKPTVVPHLKRQASVNSNKHHSGTLESIVVRIEVQDTGEHILSNPPSAFRTQRFSGVGIRPRDLVNNRLFSVC
jgi:signal transduction histidine kinase